MNQNPVLPPNLSVGHVHFIVTNLERSVDFYTRILGFHITEDRRFEPSPRQMVFLSANDYHHQIALMEMVHYQPVPKGYAGLYHAAFLYPGPYELAVAVKHIVDQQYPIDLCHDYGIGKFVNMRDPDGIPLELYYDYPPEQWPRVDGQLRMTHRNVTIEELLQPLEQNRARV
jgi:catechol 2,3-dioxygenase